MVETKKYKVIIIGSGPSGYSAAIYTSRAQLKPLLFAGESFGGQLMLTTEIENFPGFSEGILGPKLMMGMRQQAERFGTEILNKNVTKVDFSRRPFRVWSGETEYLAESVIISTGAKALTLNLTNEMMFYGKGLSTCAVCDAAFYREKKVFVVGGGDGAMEDTLALTRFAREVFLVVRRDKLRASKIMQERVLMHPKVKIMWNTEVTGIIGMQKIEKLELFNNASEEKREVEADGLFYAIGHKPESEIFKDSIQMDDKGYILTPLNGLNASVCNMYETWLALYPTMTSIEGVFAAGDVVDFRYRQAITAASYGVMAALDVEKWLENCV
jgi:thioredoxin reductase (NADPH)